MPVVRVLLDDLEKAVDDIDRSGAHIVSTMYDGVKGVVLITRRGPGRPPKEVRSDIQ